MTQEAQELQPHQSLTERILNKVQALQIDVPESEDDHWQLVEEMLAEHAANEAKLGYYFLALKERVGHGQFTKELEKRGLPVRRVQEQMQVASFLGAMPEANARTSAQLKTSQLLELTKLPDEKKQTLTPEEIEEFGQLSVRNLRAVVKQICQEHSHEAKLEQQNADLKHQLKVTQEEAADAINDYNKELLRKAPETLYGLPPLVAHVRQQVPALSQQLHEAGLDIANQLEHLMQPGLDIEQVKPALEALYCWLVGPYRQMGAVMQRLQGFSEQLGLDIVDAMLPLYSDQEWEQAEDKRKEIIRLHEARFHPNTPPNKLKKQRGKK